MQGINATLIVQVINFGIAYLILRKLVFEPGVTLVLEERAVKTRLEDEVSHAAQQAQQEKERLAAEWQAEQKKLVAQIPSLPEELFVLRRIKPELSDDVLPDKEDLVVAKKALVQAIVSSIKAQQ